MLRAAGLPESESAASGRLRRSGPVFIACDTTYDLSQVDCGLLGGNMILAAQSVGVGSCCLGGLCRFLNAPEGAELLRRLQLPDTHRLLYAIAFGYPAEMPAAKPRNREKVRFVE